MPTRRFAMVWTGSSTSRRSARPWPTRRTPSGFERPSRWTTSARDEGRYELWSKIDLDQSPRVKPMLDLLDRAQDGRLADAGGVRASPRRQERDRGEGEGLREHAQVRRHVPQGRHADRGRVALGCAEGRARLGVSARAGAARRVRAHAGGRHRGGHAEQRRVLPESPTGWARLEPGKLADLVLIDGDPLKDIAHHAAGQAGDAERPVGRAGGSARTSCGLEMITSAPCSSDFYFRRLTRRPARLSVRKHLLRHLRTRRRARRCPVARHR